MKGMIYMNQNEPVASLFPTLWKTEEELNRAASSCLTRVFLRMFAALAVTAASAYFVFASTAMQDLVVFNPFVLFGLIILELALVLVISRMIGRLSSTTANVLFFLYAIINGLTLSAVLSTFDIGTVFYAFAVSGLMFAGMALFGAVTHRDLSSVGSICIMGVFGLIIATILNIFIRSEMLETVVLYAGVLIFIGLTAYDTQHIKRMLKNSQYGSHEQAIAQISVIGALRLYLDFINLFFYILRILGRRK